MKYNAQGLNPYKFPDGTKLVSYTVLHSMRGDWLRVKYILPNDKNVRETHYGWYDKQNDKWPIKPTIRALIRGLID